MKITPLYNTEPVLAIEGLGDPSAPLRRQRERLRDLLRTLTDEQWASGSRCEKWSVKDVVSHLAGTDRFWALVIAAALRGEPTRFLTGFDPVATPEQMVDAMRSLSPGDVLAQYESGVAALVKVTSAVTDWSVLAEAPPGHLALNVTALHALWDAWIHERDIAIPLGIAPVEDHEEVTLVLYYAAALSPAFTASKGLGATGALVVDATEPDLLFTVDVGQRVFVRPGVRGEGEILTGRAAELVDGLSRRGPLRQRLSPDQEWLLAGLAEVFDQS